MAIASFSDLKTAIETFRERAGDAVITGNANDLVTLAEARLNRRLPYLREMWTNTTLPATIGSRELALPADFIEPEWLKITSSNRFDKLRAESAREMEYSATSGEPSAWCVNGDAIDLNCPADAAYTFSLRYRAKLALGSGSQATTNWLLTHHPDVYLAAVLVWSGLLIKDDDIVLWRGLLDEGIDEVTRVEVRARGAQTLKVDRGLLAVSAMSYDVTSE